MSSTSINNDEIKRKLRSLKKLETKIRFGNSNQDGRIAGRPPKAALIWDEFFDIHGNCSSKARYTLEDIASISKEDFKNVVDEFFFKVYYRYYMDNGIVNFHLYNPDILKSMGLPQYAGIEEIKKKFRELAKKYHPDTGGDAGKFIELMENYEKLMGR